MFEDFKKGDKFILEIGDRQLDEFEIVGTDYYIRISLLEKLTPYKPSEADNEFCPDENETERQAND